jgi:PII-like signaling protein
MIDIIDSDERVAALLPLLDQVVQQGIITVTAVEIVSGGRTA